MIVTNPRSFADRDHDWGQILVRHGKTFKRRGQIRDYYLEHGRKMLPYLKGHDVMVILGLGENATVIRRKSRDDKPIRIDRLKGIEDPRSIEYWANRRAIEFHPTIKQRTKWIWVDLDPHWSSPAQKSYTHKVAREAIPGIKRVLRRLYDGKIKVYDSGKEGYHVEMRLAHPVDVDRARKRIREALQDIVSGNERLTTGIAKPGQVRLDVTTLKRKGSIRSPYSFSVWGRPKRPL